ncbi:DUF1146 domain-containing protein, partial [Streptococcus agalactiae]|nr:DUF1146 domain-containing protein [Streptococcus agalactiae]MCC9699116.1 DUF1146 domain-containing protein [Streptococcus agalactiae]MCC9758520.1 DUF1146 domain-containing protein [Streptococcus agalactiae]MCC9776752.1 DUF1146 domain-containing protein [Streptococcus agalactiae]MCC9793532.1 DUF1146 domain-containing protein [Streptococcus agalactiae]
SKMIKMSPQNISKLKVFILLISIVGGYVVSHFLLEVIQLCQSIFWALQ